MKLGLGLYKSLLNDSNFQFAKQAGATHIVAQLIDYVKGGENPTLTKDYLNGWGYSPNKDIPWKLDDLVSLRKKIESHGLKLEAIENFDPAHWYDILLDGPRKNVQMEQMKLLIKNVGIAGIPVLGYYFSLAGVWGWTNVTESRGNAPSVRFDASKIDINAPIPKGMVWNMHYEEAGEGHLQGVSYTEMWERLSEFLHIMLPVAEENGVKLVAHPDDPPMENLRNSGRLFTSISRYERLLEISNSPSNGFELCLGTLQEMQEGNVYDFMEKYLPQDRIGYIHFRNVKGKVPFYQEVFVDEGDLDMVRVMKILKKYDYDGVLIPDHTPEMSCASPWHAGMAYALGFMNGIIKSLNH